MAKSTNPTTKPTRRKKTDATDMKLDLNFIDLEMDSKRMDSKRMDIPKTASLKTRSVNKVEPVKSKNPRLTMTPVYPGKSIAKGSFKEAHAVTNELFKGNPLTRASVDLPNPDIEKIVALHMSTTHKGKNVAGLIIAEIKMTHELSTDANSITPRVLAVVTNRDGVVTQYIGNEIYEIDKIDKDHITDVVIYEEKNVSLDKEFESYPLFKLNLSFFKNEIFPHIIELLDRIEEREIIERDFKIENIGLKDDYHYNLLDLDTRYTDRAEDIIGIGRTKGILVEKRALLQHSQILMRVLLYLSVFSYFTKNKKITTSFFESVAYSIQIFKQKTWFINKLKETDTDKTMIDSINGMLSYFQTLEPIFTEPKRGPIYMLYYYVLIALLNEIHYRYNMSYVSNLKEKQDNLEVYLREKHFLKEPIGKLRELLYYITGNTSSVEINYTDDNGHDVDIYFSNGYLGGSHKSRRKTYRRKPGIKKVKSRKSI